MIKSLEILLQENEPTQEQYSTIASEIFSSELNNSQIAAILGLLATKKVENQILPFAREMKKHAIAFETAIPTEEIVDTCGTGGDGSGSFNISTASALVASSCGVKIAKHGNKAASGKTGSAEVIEALGIKIQEPNKVAKTFEKTGFGFLFAQYFHPKLREVAVIRRELGFRTVFNLLGPLCNPANARRQLIGVYDEKFLVPVVNSLSQLGSQRAIVVNSNGMDEIGLDITKVAQLENGKITQSEIVGSDFGFSKQDIPKANDAKESAQIILDILKGKKGPARDIVVLNAAAALQVAGVAKTLDEAVEISSHSIDSGKAIAKLEEIRKISN